MSVTITLLGTAPLGGADSGRGWLKVGRCCGLPSVKWHCMLAVLLFVLGTAHPGAGVREAKASDSLFIVNQFEDESFQHFTHLAVDKNTGIVYAAGVNRLHQLDSNLHLLQSVTMGTIRDYIEYPASGCKDETIRTMNTTSNVNKALVIDYTRSRLIVCGTIRQGSCHVRDLQNITVLSRDVSELLVADTAMASTVAFIAPGPPNPPATHILYIGVTYTGTSYYRSEVPAVASRSLDDDRFFDIAFTDVTTGTLMFVNSLSRERYPITYVYGFGSDKFSYFLTRQMENTDAGSPYISKLVRVCQSDPDYHSYTEIPIECKDSQGKNYNLAQAASIGKPGTNLASQLGIHTNDDVLFVVFSPSDPDDGEGSPCPEKVSAMCVYSMRSVQRVFKQNIKECFRGKGDRGLNFISPSHPCIQTGLNITEDFCGIDVNTPLGGEKPVEGLALLTFPTRLTSVAATSTGVSTVVFLGTSQGHLKKVVIQNQTNAMEYNDIIVDEDAPVRQDMYFDKAGDHLYVMTDNKISKVKTQECGIYEGCDQCLRARNPDCGWCSPENKCSLERDCLNPHDWVSYETGRCAVITQVRPDKLQRTTARTLSLTVDNLTSLEGNLECVFTFTFTPRHRELASKAKRTAHGVSCTTPRTDLLPDFAFGKHHITAKLSVRETFGPASVSTNFTFFDCNSHRSCTECVSSPFPCDWCVDGHRCTHDTAENCRNDILVTGVNRIGPSIRSGPSFCPRIIPVESQEILVSSGTEKSIRVKVDSIAQFITQTRFVCQFNIEGRASSYNAALISDIIYCDTAEFTYSARKPSADATIAVIWDGSKPLDNPDDIHVSMYKCHMMADNCGKCLNLPEQYQCGWCQSKGSCEVQDQCAGGSWLDQGRTCPSIDKVTVEDTTISSDEEDSTVPVGDAMIDHIEAAVGSDVTEIGELTVDGFKALFREILDGFKAVVDVEFQRLDGRVQQLEESVLDINRKLHRILRM